MGQNHSNKGTVSSSKLEARGGPWYVYLLRCNDGSLYCGITNRLAYRFQAHQLGRGAKYTRARLPCKLVYLEEQPNRKLASQREYQVKQLSKAKKEVLVLTYT